MTDYQRKSMYETMDMLKYMLMYQIVVKLGDIEKSLDRMY